MKNNKRITTEQMLAELKKHPGEEQEYRHHLGGILCSTHWLIYDPQKQLFGDSTDWNYYDWYNEPEFIEEYSGHFWIRDA